MRTSDMPAYNGMSSYNENKAKHDSRGINPLLSVLCLLTVIAGLVFCVLGSLGVILTVKPNEKPETAAVNFLTAIKLKEYDRAYSYIDGYSSLGLENDAKSEEGRMLLSALRSSYDYELSGECVLRGATAVQKVLFTRLDLNAVNAAASEAAAGGTEYIVALKKVLEQPSAYTVTDIIDIRLTYNGKQWTVSPDTPLLSALKGGLQ